MIIVWKDFHHHLNSKRQVWNCVSRPTDAQTTKIYNKCLIEQNICQHQAVTDRDEIGGPHLIYKFIPQSKNFCIFISVFFSLLIFL
jgi:hypothetical protein